MTNDRIERDVLVEAPIDTVWSVVTEPQHIARWFADRADVELHAGGAGALTWDDHGVTAPFVVEAVEPPHRFAYRWSHPEGATPDAGNSTLVEFLLEADGEHTRLRVVESGLAEVDWSAEKKSRFASDHAEGWETHTQALRAYVAGGLREAVR